MTRVQLTSKVLLTSIGQLEGLQTDTKHKPGVLKHLQTLLDMPSANFMSMLLANFINSPLDIAEYGR